MNAHRKQLALFIAVVIFCTFQVMGWWDHTHMRLTRRAAENTQLHLGNLMLRLNLDKGLYHETLSLPYLSWFTLANNQTVMSWMRYGAVREDMNDNSWFFGAPISRRYDNHFHTPLRDYSFAGLDDWVIVKKVIFYHATGDSSILWSQNLGENNQAEYPGGDNSWKQIRRVYYSALTTPSDSNGTNEWRDFNFIATFTGLGHQMHLIEDMAVPEHVRNDGHPDKTRNSMPTFEKWADGLSKKDGDMIDIFALSPIFPTVDLNDPSFSTDYVQTAKLWDSDLYLYGITPTNSTNWGLSEYTNSNFFSEDTTFSAPEDGLTVASHHQFPFPRISSTNLNELLQDILQPKEITAEDGFTDRVLYVSKIADGEPIDHFLSSTYLESEIRALNFHDYLAYVRTYNHSFYRDEMCFEDYAEKLVPRAVGYAAALVDYFFRGKIEIALPSSENPAEPSVEAKDDGVYAFTLDPAEGFKEITLMARNVTPDEEMKNGDGVIDCSEGDSNITPNKILVHRLSFNGGVATDTNFNHEFSPTYELMPGQSMVIYVIGDEPPAPCLLSLQTSSVSTVSANTCFNWYPQGVVAMEPTVNKLEWNSEQFPGHLLSFSLPLREYRCAGWGPMSC